MRVLVTGGAGFIGSHLVDRLVAENAEVTIVDDLSCGSLENVERLGQEVRFIEDDCTKHSWDEYGSFDMIFHLAGYAATEDFVARPVEALMASVAGLWYALEYCRRYGAKMLFTSSSEVYGTPQEIPTPESCVGQVSLTGARAGYDEGKRAGEALIMSYNREYYAVGSIVRLFNVYGPRQPAKSNLIPAMIRDALSGRIVVCAPGTQTRTMLYIDDAVEAILLAAQKGYREPINVGGVEEHSVYEIAEIIRDLVNPSAEIVMGPARPGEPLRRKPDCSLARSVLGWTASTPLDVGVYNVLKYMSR